MTDKQHWWRARLRWRALADPRREYAATARMCRSALDVPQCSGVTGGGFIWDPGNRLAWELGHWPGR